MFLRYLLWIQAWYMYICELSSRLCIWANNKEFIDLMNIKSIGDEKYVRWTFCHRIWYGPFAFQFHVKFVYFRNSIASFDPFFVPLGIDRGPKGRHAIFHGISVWFSMGKYYKKILLIMLSSEYNEITVKFIDMVLSTVITVLRIK